MTGARHNIKPYPLVAVAERTINVTDPDARNLKTPRGWVQGYNAQAVVTGEQIVVAAEISTESLDTANLRPMITAAEEELTAAGVKDGLDIVLADAGYWTNSAIEALAAQGLQPLVAPDADRRKQPGRGRRGGLYDFMRRVLATDRGGELSRRRQAPVEPVFGQIKANRRADRFLRRGRSAVRSEWRLLATTHNLLKLHTDTGSPPPEARRRRSGAATGRTLTHRSARNRYAASPRGRTVHRFSRHPPRDAAACEPSASACLEVD